MRKSFTSAELTQLQAARERLESGSAASVAVLDSQSNAYTAIASHGLRGQYDKEIYLAQRATNGAGGGVAVEYALLATLARPWISGADYNRLMTPWKSVMGGQSVLS